MQNQYPDNSPFLLYFDVPVFYSDEDATNATTFNHNSVDNMTIPLFPDIMQSVSGEFGELYSGSSASVNAAGFSYGSSDDSVFSTFVQEVQDPHQQAIAEILNLSSIIINEDTSLGTSTSETLSLLSPQYYSASGMQAPQQHQEQDSFFIQQYLLQQGYSFLLDNNQNDYSSLASFSLPSPGNSVNTSPSFTIPTSSTHNGGFVSISGSPSTSFSSPGNTIITASSSSSSSSSSNRNSRQQQMKVSCPICHKQLGRQQDLNRHHSSVHAGQRDFHCKVCPSTFARKDALNRHIKTLASRGDRRHSTYQSNCGKRE